MIPDYGTETLAELSTQCEGKCWSPVKWPRLSRCTNNGKYQRDGKWYCGIHDPVAKEARRHAARNTNEKWAAEDARSAHIDMCVATHDELVRVVRMALDYGFADDALHDAAVAILEKCK